MKALKYGFGLALIGGFSLMAACGGSSSDSGSTAGESSGGNGSVSTAGATSSTAGATSSTAGTTSTAGGEGNVAGGTATGGATASGGATGEAGGATSGTAGAGQGGATMMANPADCPATAPTEAAMCTPLATNLERCAYAGESCRCRAMFGGGMQGTAGGGGAPAAAASTWQCTATCPTEKPTVGADCTPTLSCPYQGMGRCTCGQSMKWACVDPMMGTAGATGAGGATGTAGAGGATGTAGAGGATGTAGAGAACPMAKPTTGDACAVTKVCTYTNSGCACLQQKWACN